MTDELLEVLGEETEDEDVTSVSEEKLRTSISALNSKILSLNEQAQGIDSQLYATKLRLQKAFKELQRRQAQRSKGQIAAGGDELRTRPKKIWKKITKGGGHE